jgi:hypothetical protein
MMPPATRRAPKTATTNSRVEPSSLGWRNPRSGTDGGAGRPSWADPAGGWFCFPHWMHSHPPAVSGAPHPEHRRPETPGLSTPL